MSFVDEHYARVFRLLAGGLQSPASSQGSESGNSLQTEDQSLTGSSESKLIARAFNLSTQLLTEPKSSPLGSPRVADSDNRELRVYGSQFAGPQITVICPSLSSVVGDLELVRQATLHRSYMASTFEQRSAENLVLANAVAAVHAHTIQQLLESVLPLSTDIDYWSAQDGGSIPLIVYFVQSMPQRLYSWSTHVISAVYSYSLDQKKHKHSILEQLRVLMSSRYLFPVADQINTLHDSARSKRKTLRFPRVPDTVNILGLVGHEIRYKQQQLVAMQDKLATSIGILSQAASEHNMEASAEELLLQINNVINIATGSDAMLLDKETTWSGKDASAQTLLIQNIAEWIPDISSKVSRQMQNYSRPSLAIRCWIPAVVLVASARLLSSYITEHRDDFKDWIADGLFTLRNYISQYILAPLKHGYETIRYGKHTYSVMSDESLASDFRSLEDMVIGFAKRFSDVNPDDVRYRVEHGDLSDVMQVYSQEMQQPFRNAVFGDLVQAMLIQVQKVKVDVGQTMAALDKLLKSNELNFLLLSTVPATLSIYAAAKWLSIRISWWI
ncbi:Nuclear control of ATPase protein 2, partial [Coemansia sp. RSA 637]